MIAQKHEMNSLVISLEKSFFGQQIFDYDIFLIWYEQFLCLNDLKMELPNTW